MVSAVRAKYIFLIIRALHRRWQAVGFYDTLGMDGIVNILKQGQRQLHLRHFLRAPISAQICLKRSRTPMRSRAGLNGRVRPCMSDSPSDYLLFLGLLNISHDSGA
jgi:hypothetical protein